MERLDAASTLFFTRELEQILEGSFDPKYTKLKGRSLVGTGQMVDPGAESVRWESFDRFGVPELITDHSSDSPQANANAVEAHAYMKSYGLGFGYSFQEIEAARLAGRSVDQARAMACRMGQAEKLDYIIAFGDTLAGSKGLLNQASAQDITGDLNGTWASASADDILEDLFNLVDAGEANTNECEKVTRLVLPTTSYRLISSKPRTTGTDTTVLKFFTDNRPGIEVTSWHRCNTADGAGTGPRVLAYNPDVNNVRLLLAHEYKLMAPQQRNRSMWVESDMRTGGVISMFPKSLIYGDIA